MDKLLTGDLFPWIVGACCSQETVVGMLWALSRIAKCLDSVVGVNQGATYSIRRDGVNEH